MAYNPYENVLKVMDEAAQILGYSESDIEPLKYPERELKVSVPVVMDDGSTRVFHIPRTGQGRYPFPSGGK